MATRTPVECPLCREVLTGRSLEEHLVDGHTKRKLAKFVVSETEAMNDGKTS
ncbi:hypothetical protein [Natrarchaeobius halalkaliphilus]|uniref:hypothetical protein n=1 Tax=Natrarchaeobius halalkaliphilus TaxID=1679091 RepID=UPI001404EA44|nr:hypothetical protein [Natrarchaeobius halalkaliphilus]